MLPFKKKLLQNDTLYILFVKLVIVEGTQNNLVFAITNVIAAINSRSPTSPSFFSL